MDRLAVNTDVKKVCMELLLEVDRICKKHNIRYFIYGGTLLGAVRHQGFIPWDDDIDLVMFRKDYIRFVQICGKDLKMQYFLETVDSEPFSIVTWGKLHKKGTAFIHDNVPRQCFQGISIDIFALDKIPKNKLKRALFGFLHDKLNFIYNQRFARRALNPSLRRRIFNLFIDLTRIIPDYRLKKLYQRLSNKYNCSDSQYLIHNSYRKFKKKIMPIEFFEDTCLLEFEGLYFSAPKKWHNILTSYYGENYMEIPSINERFIHHSALIDPYNSWEMYINTRESSYEL